VSFLVQKEEIYKLSVFVNLKLKSEKDVPFSDFFVDKIIICLYNKHMIKHGSVRI